ncbi:MAG: quinone oxidoreductase [Pseudomonadota bacterium]
MKTRGIILHQQGAPSVMRMEDVDLAEPAEGEVLVEHSAIGVNYMDVYQRSGAYKLDLPSGIGLEAAGRIASVGPGVDTVSVGDRVVYGPALGAYAVRRVIKASRVAKIPEGIDDETAAAVLLKGMTAEYLLNRAYSLTPKDTVLFYAASGGVGQIAGQWARHLGVRMIGVTSGRANCEAILGLGYDAAIDRKTEDIAARTRELTDGEGVSVVYDSVGAATFEASINALRPRGYFFSFGATTGEAPAVKPSLLQYKGSLYFCRPTLANYVGTDADFQYSAGEVLRLTAEGVIKPHIGQRWPLNEAPAAHEALEAATTTGSSLLMP